MSAINTYTLYSHYARQQNAAIAEIARLRRFLFFSDVGVPENELIQQIIQHPNDYLVTVDPLNTPLQEQINHLDVNDVAGRQERQDRLEQYVARYDVAVNDYRGAVSHLRLLTVNGDRFLAPETQRDNYLHVLDEETCRYICTKDDLDEDCFCSFADKQITLENNQTDAVRIWRNNVIVSHLSIRDPRSYTDIGHRDGIQLLPPPLYEEQVTDQGTVRIKIGDQSSGTILENVEIRDCVIDAPQAALQGIFSSDGMCRNLTIDNIEVTTKGAHSISLAGLLTDCEINNVTLNQVAGGAVPQISLYPLRIGGNMADEGVLYVLAFDGTAGFEYGRVAQRNNQVTLQGQAASRPTQINDRRHEIPMHYLTFAFGLRAFNFQQYRHEYSQWTVDTFKREMPAQFEQMEAWLDLRIREYNDGQRELGSSLPPVSHEQMSEAAGSILNRLREAQQALTTYTSAFKNTRLPELQETPIRTFAMKSIALRNGELMPLVDLGVPGNSKRRDYLQFLLAEEHFENLVQHPQDVDAIQFINPSDTWASNGDVLPDLRISAEIVNQGELISIFLHEESEFNDGYSFFWRIAGVDDAIIPFSHAAQYDIDTSSLDAGQQRIQLALHSPQETISVSVFFTVLGH